MAKKEKEVPKANSTECLQFSNVYGKDPIIRMGYRADRALVDLSPFFNRAFHLRDEEFGAPEHPRRSRIDGWTTEYAFTPTEFAESFFCSYRPKEISEFLRRHVPEGDVQSESFLKTRVDCFDSSSRSAIVGAFGYGGFGSVGSSLHFKAFNFASEELSAALRQSIPPKFISKSKKRVDYLRIRGNHSTSYGNTMLAAGTLSVLPVLMNKRGVFKTVRAAFLALKKPIILFRHSEHMDVRLDDFSFLKHFDIDTTGLRLIREGPPSPN